MLLPKPTISIALFVWTVWFTFLGYASAFSHLIQNWEITVTMMFGSIIAGATSLGGGAVAFPIFTKVLQIPPPDAKTFSLAIQAVGMSAAAGTIYLTKIPVEWRVIRWGSLGGIVGIYLSLTAIAPALPPDLIRMSFTMMLASFAITLLALNARKRYPCSQLPTWGTREKQLFFLMGIIGGIMSGLVGNGIDIILFSVMVLLFKVSEKVATPTSVILMAFNAVIGFGLQFFLLQDFSLPIQNYWLAAIPVVVIGAPVGALFCNALPRQMIANCLIGLIAIEVLSSIILIPLRPIIIYTSLLTLLLFSSFNYWMSRRPIQSLIPQENAHL